MRGGQFASPDKSEELEQKTAGGAKPPAVNRAFLKG